MVPGEERARVGKEGKRGWERREEEGEAKGPHPPLE